MFRAFNNWVWNGTTQIHGARRIPRTCFTQTSHRAVGLDDDDGNPHNKPAATFKQADARVPRRNLLTKVQSKLAPADPLSHRHQSSRVAPLKVQWWLTQPTDYLPTSSSNEINYRTAASPLPRFRRCAQAAGVEYLVRYRPRACSQTCSICSFWTLWFFTGALVETGGYFLCVRTYFCT